MMPVKPGPSLGPRTKFLIEHGVAGWGGGLMGGSSGEIKEVIESATHRNKFLEHRVLGVGLVALVRSTGLDGVVGVVFRCSPGQRRPASKWTQAASPPAILIAYPGSTRQTTSACARRYHRQPALRQRPPSSLSK